MHIDNEYLYKDGEFIKSNPYRRAGYDAKPFMYRVKELEGAVKVDTDVRLGGATFPAIWHGAHCSERDANGRAIGRYGIPERVEVFEDAERQVKLFSIPMSGWDSKADAPVTGANAVVEVVAVECGLSVRIGRPVVVHRAHALLRVERVCVDLTRVFGVLHERRQIELA